MVIKQGEIYWLDMDEPRESEPGFRRPCVIVQNDAFNQSKINTVVACLLTSNIKLATAPGNVVLRKGDGNLPKASVVNVSQISTLNKLDLKQKIGHLSKARIKEIIDGIDYLIQPRII